MGTADDPGLEGENDDRRLEPRIEPDDLAWLDDQAGLLERLADRRFRDGLVDFEEAAGLGPPATTGLDPTAKEDDLAGLGDRDRRDDEPRIDIGDVAADLTGKPLAILPLDGPEPETTAASGAEVQRRGEPRGDAAA